MCFAMRGKGGRSSQCTVQTTKSVDNGGKIFDIILKVKITIVKIHSSKYLISGARLPIS